MTKRSKINSLNELVYLYPNKQWIFDLLANNPSITTSIIYTLYPYNRYVMEQLILRPSSNDNLSSHEIMQLITKHPNQPGLWYEWLQNSKVTLQFIRNHPSVLWNYSGLSKNPNLTWEFIQNHLTTSWDWFQLSQHPNITWQIIQTNPNLPWCWSFVSQNPHITMEIVDHNVNKLWDIFILCKHPNMTCDIIQNKNFYPNTSFFWSSFSQNINVTWQFVENHPTLPWNWHSLSSNSNMSFEEVTDTLWKPWCFEKINPQRIPFLELKNDLQLTSLTYGMFLQIQ